MKRDHRVLLCRRAIEILDAARALADDGNPVVFPNARGKRRHDKRLRRLLWKHRIPAMVHGFRSSFRDWAAEETDHPREVIEAALAHVVQNKVEAAYAQSDLFGVPDGEHEPALGPAPNAEPAATVAGRSAEPGPGTGQAQRFVRRPRPGKRNPRTPASGA